MMKTTIVHALAACGLALTTMGAARPVTKERDLDTRKESPAEKLAADRRAEPARELDGAALHDLAPMAGFEAQVKDMDFLSLDAMHRDLRLQLKADQAVLDNTHLQKLSLEKQNVVAIDIERGDQVKPVELLFLSDLALYGLEQRAALKVSNLQMDLERQTPSTDKSERGSLETARATARASLEAIRDARRHSPNDHALPDSREDHAALVQRAHLLSDRVDLVEAKLYVLERAQEKLLARKDAVSSER